MAIPALQERSLGALSRLQVQYFVGPCSHHPHLQLLVIKYSGAYPRGMRSGENGRFLMAMARAGVTAFEPWGVVHDLSEFTYDWDDRLDLVFNIGPDAPAETRDEHGTIQPTQETPRAGRPAVVVGPGCEEAIRRLLLGKNSKEPIAKIGYVFRDLKTAWEFVDAQIA
jgi:hypothetical protein